MKRIKETCIYIADIERCKGFYHEKLGLPVIGISRDRHIFFRAGDSVLLCFIGESTKNETKLPSHFAEGNQHFAFECDREDYDEILTDFKNAGIEIEQEVKWDSGLRSFYFRDPDRHLVEVVTEGLWGD